MAETERPTAYDMRTRVREALAAASRGALTGEEFLTVFSDSGIESPRDLAAALGLVFSVLCPPPHECKVLFPPPIPQPVTPPRVAPIYAFMSNGDLLWNRHDGHENGSSLWASDKSKFVTTLNAGGGDGIVALKVFSGGDGIIYAVMRNGDLVWSRHDGWRDGTPQWTSLGGIPVVGHGWHSAAHVFAGHDGVVYAVYNNGQVLWNRHEGRTDGTFRWALANGRNVANSVNKFAFSRAAHVFAGGAAGIIYVVMDDGELLWFRHDGWQDGTATWALDQGQPVGSGWHVKAAFALRNTDYVYAVMPNNELLWNTHLGSGDGTFRWALHNGQPVGWGWDVRQAFSG